MLRRLLVSALIVLGVVAAPTRALAAGESGALLAHGPVGSAFAGPGAYLTGVTSKGGSVSFAVKVLNTGTALSQYNLRLSVTPFTEAGCDLVSCAAPPVTASLAAGSLIVTPLSAGPNGYYTAPIAAGKSAAYTLKLTAPASEPPGYEGVAELDLYDTSGNQLNHDSFQLNVSATTGTSGTDVFANLPGHPAIVGSDTNATGRDAVLSGPQIAVGAANAFTVKIRNDSTATNDVSALLVQFTGCAQYRATVKNGTSDISAAIVNQDLHGTNVADLGNLAPGKTITLSVTITPTSDPLPCVGTDGPDFWGFAAFAGSPTPQNDVYFALNPQQH